MKDWTFGRYSKFDHVFSCEQFMFNDKTEKTWLPQIYLENVDATSILFLFYL